MTENNSAAANSTVEFGMLPSSNSTQSEMRRHRFVIPRRKPSSNAGNRFMMLVLSVILVLVSNDPRIFVHASSSNYNYNNYYSQSNDDTAGDDGNSGNSQQTYYNGNGITRYSDDDVFHWTPAAGFEGVSVMPISCVN